MRYALIIFGLLALGFLVCAIYPLFNEIEVDEAPPTVVNEEVTEVESVTIVEAESPEPIPKTFPVVDTPTHPASGTVRVLETENGQVIRYEDFETINGPNLHVYLAKDLDADEFVDLGPIKGTKGNINYDVPEGVDLSEYRYVMYWCVPFGVLFNYADLSS